MEEGRKNQKVRQTFHGFHSERQETTHSLESKPHSRIKQVSEENSDLTLQLPIHHALRTILIEFKRALKQNEYKCIDMCQKQILVIRLTLADRAKKLFLCQEPPKFIITIHTHQFLSVRQATIKTLKSNSQFTFKRDAEQDPIDEVKKIYEILIQLSHLFRPQEELINQLDGQYQQDFYSLDATSYYMFSRMLVDSNYTLGKKMQIVSQKFKEQTFIASSSKEELKWLSAALAQMSKDLLQGFNCSRKQLLQILAYCRKSVEEYFYTRHTQAIANQEKQLPKQSSTFPSQIKELQKILPATFKELQKLQNAKTTMDIYRAMFMAGLIFRVEVEIKAISEESMGRALYLIRTCFSGIIHQQSRILLCSGYHQQDYEDFINKFNFDHQVTF